MANIAVICEGASEFKMIEYVVSKYCGFHNINCIQPELSGLNQRQSSFGGWMQVLEHCTPNKLNDIFQFNDFIIIQIDTDTSHMPHYDVKKSHPNGMDKSHHRLHAEIMVRLMRNFNCRERKEILPKIAFAICNNEMECWLLPIFYSDNRACKTNNCIYTLNQALAKKNMPCVPTKDKNSPEGVKAYAKILKNVRRKEDVIRLASFSFGFNAFLLGLDKHCID